MVSNRISRTCYQKKLLTFWNLILQVVLGINQALKRKRRFHRTNLINANWCFRNPKLKKERQVTLKPRRYNTDSLHCFNMPLMRSAGPLSAGFVSRCTCGGAPNLHARGALRCQPQGGEWKSTPSSQEGGRCGITHFRPFHLESALRNAVLSRHLDGQTDRNQTFGSYNLPCHAKPLRVASGPVATPLPWASLSQ